jgi:hypothetical protein
LFLAFVLGEDDGQSQATLRFEEHPVETVLEVVFGESYGTKLGIRVTHVE